MSAGGEGSWQAPLPLVEALRYQHAFAVLPVFRKTGTRPESLASEQLRGLLSLDGRDSE